MNRPLAFVGGGGHCKSVIEAAESSGLTVGCILDMPEYVGTEICGYKVVGTDDEIPLYTGEYDFIVTVGYIKDRSLRHRIIDRVEQAGGKFGKVIASGAHVSPHAEIGEGSVVLHNACVNAGSRIGRNCIVNTAAVIEHDAVVGDNAHISTGAMVNGNAIIGEETFIGSGAIVGNGVTVCPRCTVGAGCVVINDITEPGVYVGVPARKIRNG